MAKRITLNGKFLAAAPTGVHRVAQELGSALADLIAERHPAARGLSLEVAVPRNGLVRADSMPIPARRIAPFVHIPWEQITLPLRRGPGVLLSLCNIAPVLSRNAVTMIHDVQVLLSPGSYGRAFRLWYRLVQPLIARRHRLLLTVSDYSRQQIADVGLCPAERVVVIPNGGDHALAPRPDPTVLTRLGLARAGYVLALANTQVHKNIGVLLRTFADPALAGTRLVLFGGAGADEFVAAGQAVPDSVAFAGKVSDGQLRALMEGALCLAFPSTTEGFGLPPLEAMTLGCPVVAAPCGALPEVCGAAALYAGPDSEAEWIAAICALRDYPEQRASAIARGRERAAAFTWRAAAQRLAEVLTAL